ncbi:uncharacterized protein LOC132205333 isoform X2 [Neocloeon triangulifer]|uniref:uncharacterized protein LOC132205333 isoform X2 n=1 Tax=Neocloeon triangulifer TaxID=2078957 RepID=UPI00286F1773|nr:uncharacterized protein LOC132205333 isoform X2 [Neocloeon triangulifer]
MPKPMHFQMPSSGPKRISKQKNSNFGTTPVIDTLPPFLYSRVMSKKGGRMDDLSVSSFDDLSMFKPGSSLTDVVRENPPVYYGPKNSRGRRASIHQEYNELVEPKINYQLSLPAGMAQSLLNTSQQSKVLVQPAFPPMQILLDRSALGKFKDVPPGLGLQEQRMGDFTARPARCRGRPQKMKYGERVNYKKNIPDKGSEEESAEEEEVSKVKKRKTGRPKKGTARRSSYKGKKKAISMQDVPELVESEKEEEESMEEEQVAIPE